MVRESKGAHPVMYLQVQVHLFRRLKEQELRRRARQVTNYRRSE